jgi:putative BNR repeat neuraminidase
LSQTYLKFAFLSFCIVSHFFAASFCFGESSPTKNSEGYSLEILPIFSSSPGNQNVFSTPITFYQGSLFTVSVESGTEKNNGPNLLTVVRKGRKNDHGLWEWESKKTIDDHTLFDPWHTQPSIGVDRKGYIHIAYNMHNLPWQYVVSKQPGDISSFEFLGDKITLEEKVQLQVHNKTSFPSLGTAAIPGNQITYPAFFNDRNGELYVTFRYATRPARQFKERAFAAGLAKYDVHTKKWKLLGGDVRVTAADAQFTPALESNITKPFAFDNHWSVYSHRLVFDKLNNMHVTWMWREGGAGEFHTHPSYAFSSDGGETFFRSNRSRYNLPITVSQSEIYIEKSDMLEFSLNPSLAVDSEGSPHMIVNPKNQQGRQLIYYDHNKSQWSVPQPTPYGASDLFIDSNDAMWAVAKGPRIFHRRNKSESKWDPIISDEGFCYPKIFPAQETSGIFIHTQSCSLDSIKIYWLSTGTGSFNFARD